MRALSKQEWSLERNSAFTVHLCAYSSTEFCRQNSNEMHTFLPKGIRSDRLQHMELRDVNSQL